MLVDEGGCQFLVGTPSIATVAAATATATVDDDDDADESTVATHDGGGGGKDDENDAAAAVGDATTSAPADVCSRVTRRELSDRAAGAQEATTAATPHDEAFAPRCARAALAVIDEADEADEDGYGDESPSHAAAAVVDEAAADEATRALVNDEQQKATSRRLKQMRRCMRGFEDRDVVEMWSSSVLETVYKLAKQRLFMHDGKYKTFLSILSNPKKSCSAVCFV